MLCCEVGAKIVLKLFKLLNARIVPADLRQFLRRFSQKINLR